MIINKFIILLCLIFIILLLLKISRENFESTKKVFTTELKYNCADYENEAVCKVYENSGVCKWHGDKCKPVCRFSANTLENQEKIDTGTDSTQKFEKCIEVCGAEVADNSYCDTTDCLDRCNQQDYGGRKGLIRYEPRDPTIAVKRHYDDVVDRVETLLDDPTHQVYKQIIDPLKEYTLSKIGNDRAVELKGKVEELNNITGILDGLKNNTGLDINNKGSYKFVENLERLINKKRSLNDNLEYQVKAKMIQDKIGQIKTLTDNWKIGYEHDTGIKIGGVFKSVRCLGNGGTLHIEAIIYGTSPKQYIKKDKEYLIRVNGNILFYEKRNKTDNTTTCPTDADCDFTLTNGKIKEDIDTDNGFSVDVSENPDLRAAGAYFYVTRIDNSRTYNTIIKKSGKFNFDNNDLKYPFYIIQPSNPTTGEPGNDKCINMKKMDAGVVKLTMEPCSNKPTERFEANPYTVFADACK